MPKVSIKVIRKVVSSKLGGDVIDLVLTLKKNDEISEFDLADMLKEDINSIRNKLYRLQQQNLISFKKKKDETKGWYVYFWSLKTEMFSYIHKKMLEKEMNVIKDTIETEQDKAYYSCPNGCLQVSSEEALSMNYQCPDCGALLSPIGQDTKLLNKLEKRKERLTKAMERLA